MRGDQRQRHAHACGVEWLAAHRACGRDRAPAFPDRSRALVFVLGQRDAFRCERRLRRRRRARISGCRRSLLSKITRAETWLPLAVGVAWWGAMYPGLFGEDSLITLEQARSGNVDVWFTAWWVYVIGAISLGTRAIALLTLCGV